MACYGILREFQEKLKNQAPKGQGPNSSQLPGIGELFCFVLFRTPLLTSIAQNFSPVTSHSGFKFQEEGV